MGRPSNFWIPSFGVYSQFLENQDCRFSVDVSFYLCATRNVSCTRKEKVIYLLRFTSKDNNPEKKSWKWTPCNISPLHERLRLYQRFKLPAKRSKLLELTANKYINIRQNAQHISRTQSFGNNGLSRVANQLFYFWLIVSWLLPKQIGLILRVQKQKKSLKSLESHIITLHGSSLTWDC